MSPMYFEYKILYNYTWVTMNLKNLKKANLTNRGSSVVQQVYILSVLMCLKSSRELALSPAQASVNRGPGLNHRQHIEAPCLRKHHTLSPFCRSHRSPATLPLREKFQQFRLHISLGTDSRDPLSRRKDTVGGVHPKNPIALTILGEHIPTSATITGQNKKACPM